MTGGACHGLVEGLAGGRKDGEDGKGQSEPSVKGYCAEALPKILEMGPELVWRLQAETQQMGLALKRGHLWGGTEAERVTVFWVSALHCCSVVEGTGVQMPSSALEDAPGTRL